MRAEGDKVVAAIGVGLFALLDVKIQNDIALFLLFIEWHEPQVGITTSTMVQRLFAAS